MSGFLLIGWRCSRNVDLHLKLPSSTWVGGALVPDGELKGIDVYIP